MNSNKISSKGDFITSPEISQIFAEMIGIWQASVWEERNQSDKPRRLMEFGPGTGRLMLVLIHVFNQFDLLNNLEINMVEVSPALAKIQLENISKYLS